MATKNTVGGAAKKPINASKTMRDKTLFGNTKTPDYAKQKNEMRPKIVNGKKVFQGSVTTTPTKKATTPKATPSKSMIAPAAPKTPTKKVTLLPKRVTRKTMNGR